MRARIAKLFGVFALCAPSWAPVMALGLFVSARDGMSKPAPTHITQDAVPAVARAVSLLAGAPRPLVLDPSLDHVAARHAADVVRSASNATNDAIAAAVAREGLSDARVLPFATVGTSREAPKGKPNASPDTARARRMTHVGAAAASLGGRTALVVFVRRLPVRAAHTEGEGTERRRARRIDAPDPCDARISCASNVCRADDAVRPDDRRACRRSR